MRYTFHDGIAFTEGEPSHYTSVQEIKVELGGMLLSHAQLKSLIDVKRQLARKARAANGNAIVNFKYGQRSVGFLRSLLQIDDVNWYGGGTIAVVDPSDLPRDPQTG